MKLNLRFLCMAAVLAATGVSYGQTEDISPTSGAPVSSDDRAQFDLQFHFDIGANGTTTFQSLAGVALINNEYWISQWNTDRIMVLNFDGSVKLDTTILGVTGIRSITWDGTSVYMGGASTAIYQVNPANYSLISTINITTTSNAEARMCTYDETLDGGNGGFWIGDFSSDIASVSMTGAELSVIPSATHGLTMYGGAYDNLSPDGPWLWIHDQSGNAPNRSHIVQINPTTGVPTGVSYDYLPDALPTTTECLAGGLYVSPSAFPATNSLVGLSQSTPSNEIFSLELTASTAGINGPKSLGLEMYPNPATSEVRISTGISGALNVEVLDISGKTVMSKVITNTLLNVSDLTTGIYLVKVSQNGISSTQKLVVK